MLTTYKSGAEQEAEIVTRYESGAEVEAEAVYAFKNGAEEEVWSAIKYLIKKSNDISVGELFVGVDGLSLYLYKEQHGSDGSIAGGGTIVFYLDGEWTNPNISFDWMGGMVRSNSSESTWYKMSAGSIGIYTRTTDGTESTKGAVSSVGETESGADIDTGLSEGSYSGTLEGTFNRLGLTIDMRGWNGTFYNASVDISVSNLKFNSTKIAFPKSAEFDYT